MTVPIEDGRSAASRFRCSIPSNRASFSVMMLTLPGVLPSSGVFFGCFGGGQYGPSSPSTSPFVGLSFGLKRLSIGEKMLSKKPSTGFGATGLVGGIPLGNGGRCRWTRRQGQAKFVSNLLNACNLPCVWRRSARHAPTAFRSPRKQTAGSGLLDRTALVQNPFRSKPPVHSSSPHPQPQRHSTSSELSLGWR